MAQFCTVAPHEPDDRLNQCATATSSVGYPGHTPSLGEAMNTPTPDRRHTGRSPQERSDRRIELERLWAEASRPDPGSDPRPASDDLTTPQPSTDRRPDSERF